PHAVDLYDNKAQLSLCLHGGVSTERLGNKRILWASVDVFNHRVLPGRIKIGWPNDDAPDIGLSITGQRGKDLGRLPTELPKFLDISALDLLDYFSICRTAQFGNSWQGNARPRVDVVLHVR